ncbi:MAG: hypothetical protein A3G96_05510 [Gammaproteobacteria bacterium RIFCSPLOWO2_12_FULL_52_10]|nr:MAG: hypothetical protein A3G96_05510 [Gammaproteobacteria bacterium RIFCSPLOWO2_12_FULL_52_10]
MKQYVATAVLLIIVPAIAWAADITTTGELIVDPPTLMAIGIAWPIEGDDNRNARVSISYRKKGEVEWSQGLDPLRLQNEQTYTRGSLDYTAPNMFAGSLFDLEEDTEYEVRLQLQDPDGVQGGSGKTVAIRTRAEPQPASNGRIFHVYPPGYAGNRQEPAFSGLLEAYYMASLGGDWSRASPPRVRPGDIIKVHAGVYLSKHDHYSHELNSRFTTCCGTPWDATYYLTQDGTAERPIAIVAAGDGEVIFDGDGNAVLFNLMGAQYHYFEGISFRNTGTAIEAGMKDIAGAQGITVKHSRFENIGTAVHSDWSGSSGFYIADNDMLGREDLNYVYTWYAIKPWSDRPDFAERAKLKSFYAISIYGQGHVIAYNRVRGFHDGIDHATYGMPDNYPDTPQERLPVAIDIYNNDVSVVHDNCFEADGSVRNVRVMRNRCFNAPLGAMSPQPVLGGPVYFIRNVVYNAWWGPVKIHGEPSGVYYLNNTYIGEFKQLTPMSNVHLRNNLLLGQGTAPRLLSLDTFTNYSSSDYNGFRPNPESQEAFAWNSPPFEEVRNFYPAHRDPLQNTHIALTQRVFPTLQAYSQATSQDRHSRLVDYDIFVHAPMPDFSDPTHVVAVDSVDLRLRENAAAIDAGIELPNVTDGFKGSAPDLGAYEFGEPLPHYGPRPRPD